LTETYDRALRELARRAASELGIILHERVYAELLGPSYETPAEIRMLRNCGADAVGMSTVLEAIALRHAGVRVGALSNITNAAAGLSTKPLHHDDVQATARRSEAAFVSLLRRWIALSCVAEPGSKS
jgi:purine-nucleoside phosphorylase